jgi:hypothetical protein
MVALQKSVVKSESPKVRRLYNGISPLSAAILILGGVNATARRLGIPPKEFDLMLKQRLGLWEYGHVCNLAYLSGIPWETLGMSADEMAARRLPRGRRL